ncbi:hypothetical protein TB2_003460 [Malus domestica]
MKEGHLWLDHNLVEVTVVVLLEIGETWISFPHPGRGTAELFFRCQQCDDETRERLDGVEALDGEEGLEPEVAIVTEKPDPERELHRNRGVAKIVGDAESEPVVIEENIIEIFVEELRGDRAFELVEAEIQRLLGIGLGPISWQNHSVTQ